MSLKSPKHHRWIWYIITLISVIGLLIVTIPPMITLNGLKPKLQTAILQQTGIPAQINGDVNFSLLGNATIVAHDITIPNGTIGDISFTVPLFSIFDLESARLTGNISVHNGHIKITQLHAPRFNHNIDIYNTSVFFMDRDYNIIRGRISDNGFNGTVRTNQHKYDVTATDNEFAIRNQNNNLEIVGQLYSDGTARGQIAIETRYINRWFEFSEPKITDNIRLTANFDWDGGYGFQFTDINANDTIFGNIILSPDGTRTIELRGTDTNIDMSFLLAPTNILQNTKFDLDFYGELTLSNNTFNHIRVLATGTQDALFIDTITADNTTITGGTIYPSGAKNLLIKTIYENHPAQCMFSGTPTSWSCNPFVWNDMTGTITVNKNQFDLIVQSKLPMPDNDTITHHTSRLGRNGHIEFSFSDMAGTLDIDRNRVTPHYSFATDKTLQWINPNFKFLPDFMKNDSGDFTWRNDKMDFNPHSNRWFLSLTDKRFFMSGTNIRDLFPRLDLQSINNLPYTITGAYNRGNISDLRIQIGDQEFTGNADDNGLTIKTNLLNLDAFINQSFVDNYQELSFLTGAPIMIPFDMNTNIYLTADRLIYNGDEYANFVYSLKPNVQTFSISDNRRGNMLAIIEKNKTAYDISLQMNKFVSHGTLLHPTMPLNVMDTTITADIEMTTHGIIAHDLEHNLAAKIKLLLDGGYIIGLGIDDFYASAENITRFNAEYALSDAFTSGRSKLKSMRIIGEYRNGNFQTTEPMVIQLRHTDVTGEMEITDGNMNTVLSLTMRGTAPTPGVIKLQVAPDNSRHYALSDIMREFDASFMRAFVKTHDRF